MNKFLIIAAVCMLISLYNMLVVIFTGNGISLLLGVFWLAGSAYIFIQYRKMKAKEQQKEQEAIEE